GDARAGRPRVQRLGSPVLPGRVLVPRTAGRSEVPARFAREAGDHASLAAREWHDLDVLGAVELDAAGLDQDVPTVMRQAFGEASEAEATDLTQGLRLRIDGVRRRSELVDEAGEQSSVRRGHRLEAADSLAEDARRKRPMSERRLPPSGSILQSSSATQPWFGIRGPETIREKPIPCSVQTGKALLPSCVIRRGLPPFALTTYTSSLARRSFENATRLPAGEKLQPFRPPLASTMPRRFSRSSTKSRPPFSETGWCASIRRLSGDQAIWVTPLASRRGFSVRRQRGQPARHEAALVGAVRSHDPNFLRVASKELRVGDRLHRGRLLRASATGEGEGRRCRSRQEKFHVRDSFLTKTPRNAP